LVNYKLYLWQGSSPANGRWDDGTVQYVSAMSNDEANSTHVSLKQLHDGAGWWPTTYTTTFIRLPRNTHFKLKVQAMNSAGYSLMSPESALVQTNLIAEPFISMRLLYDGAVVLGRLDDQDTYISNDHPDDAGDTIRALNTTFVQEWSAFIGIPTNRWYISSISEGHVYRLLKRTNFLVVNLTILGESDTTETQMMSVAMRFRAQTIERGSQMQTMYGMMLRKIDWGYFYIDWGDNTDPEEYIWQLGVSDKPSNRLSGPAALVLGLIVFVWFPAWLSNWLPFYYAKRAEGLDTNQIVWITLKLWYAAMRLYYLHCEKTWNKFLQSPSGKRFKSVFSCCFNNKVIKPEDIDPMTGLPFGFDPKYFPNGMPPDAMQRYEENMRADRAGLAAKK